jgi:hypothetical protein
MLSALFIGNTSPITLSTVWSPSVRCTHTEAFPVQPMVVSSTPWHEVESIMIVLGYIVGPMLTIGPKDMIIIFLE